MTDVPRCGRCNRKLKDPKSLARGMGKVCYTKHLEYTERFCISLFDVPVPVKKPKKKTA